MRKFSVVVAIGIWIGGLGLRLNADEITLDMHNTGEGAAGQADTYWTYGLIADPGVYPAQMKSAVKVVHRVVNGQEVFPFNYWSYQPYTDAAWIAPQAEYGGGQTDVPNQDYLFETKFNIPQAVDTSTVVVTGTFSSDNCTTDIMINGYSTGISARAGTCLSQQHVFTITSNAAATDLAHAPEIDGMSFYRQVAFHTGQNTIQFRVHNIPGVTWNPVGLIVSLEGSGYTPWVTPEGSTAGLLLLGLGALAGVRLRRRK